MDNIITVVCTRSIEDTFSIDFQKIYDYVKQDMINDNYAIIQDNYIRDHFCDNVEYYIKRIYNYRIEDNSWNDGVIETICERWENWIKNKNLKHE